MVSKGENHGHNILQPSPAKRWELVLLSLKPGWLLTCFDRQNVVEGVSLQDKPYSHLPLSLSGNVASRRPM